MNWAAALWVNTFPAFRVALRDPGRRRGQFGDALDDGPAFAAESSGFTPIGKELRQFGMGNLLGGI